MKILLLGEFSGFFKNLKLGFQEEGHDVTLIAGKDGWKKVDGADVLIESSLVGILRKIDIRLKYLYHLNKMKNFDVVLIINPNFFPRFIANILIKYLNKYNTKIFLSACGDDVEYISYGKKGNYRWWPFMDWCEDVRKDYYQTNFELSIHEKICKIVDGVIPSSFEYADAWRHSKNAKKVKCTIPLPIDTGKISFIPYKEKKKIVFFHGLNRECFKGTKYIREAMKNIQKKYPNDVECIIEGGLPLNEYLNIMSKTDVVLDQCKVYSYNSMNSIYAMSQGKILMAGMQKECYIEFNLEKSPVINIEPNVKQIESQMEFVIKNKAMLSQWSKETREFVEKYHDTKIIAKQYLKVFMN